jgi:endoglucanase
MKQLLITLFLTMGFLSFAQQKNDSNDDFHINGQEYLERRGANVMLAHDFYPESHQGGVGIIQNGLRVATNGDLRLEPTPGQWQPVPKVGNRVVDRTKNEISVKMSYPDSSKDKKGFNPIIYPDLNMSYTLKVVPQGKSFKIIVDLDQPIPKEWVGKVGMNIELFPGILFGKTYYMDNDFGLFNKQVDGPGVNNSEGEYRIQPMASGKVLVIAPETPEQRMKITNLKDGNLELLDGRAEHNNGWFVVRSLVPAGATKNAIEWLITPNTMENFLYSPVVQISQVGYHPAQGKIAVIETDKNDQNVQNAKLLRVKNEGGFEEVLSQKPKHWGDFLRYKYYQLDFTAVEKPGMYAIKYGNYTTEPFQIDKNVYKRDVWQPTLEYFLPVQMCHMRINDRYKVWHGRCHLDDARMAPINLNHFDGYFQGPSTLTKYKSGDHVPGLNVGGWHDAGDFDLRVESQAETVQGLSHIYELFGVDYDNTSIDQKSKTVEIMKPDGKPDILQQIEHGALSIVGGYKSMGRFYRGIIAPTKRQYVLLGDAVNQTDGLNFSNNPKDDSIPMGESGAPDDRWVFTEDNPNRELSAASGLAASARTLSKFNPELASDCLAIAQEIWKKTKAPKPWSKLELAAELLMTTKNEEYSNYITSIESDIVSNIANTGWIVGPVMPLIKNESFKENVRKSVKEYYKTVVEQGEKTPYGMPYQPDIWGAGWGIQNFGMKQYYFHNSFPEVFPTKYILSALNFVLGAHPGVNTSSFASGVGSRSLTQAYGANRGEASYIPGGIGSGTALIRPDFPELLQWPFLWQQTEYVLGGGTTDYLFLVFAADSLLNKGK